MKFIDFIKDRVMLLLLQGFAMFLLAGFLYATGYPTAYGAVIFLCWLLLLLAYLAVEYYRRKRYFKQMAEVLEHVDQRYLLGELMPESFRLEDHIYQDMIRKSNKSVIERISQIEAEQKDYREYIESWVHEIKAPITGISLMCENHRDELTRRISLENQKIENYVDMALYYARSEEVYKDYVIQETDLQEVAREVLAKNKHYLIQNGIQAEVDCRHRAFTDQKWISFILNQLVLNATKYKGDSNACIKVETQEYAHGVRLLVSDNGIGIKEEELGRIYDKGFTGSNGRTHERSTGMGLYLCRKLCGRLGIDISARSREGAGTQIILEFPVSSYLSKL